MDNTATIDMDMDTLTVTVDVSYAKMVRALERHYLPVTAETLDWLQDWLVDTLTYQARHVLAAHRLDRLYQDHLKKKDAAQNPADAGKE